MEIEMKQTACLFLITFCFAAGTSYFTGVYNKVTNETKVQQIFKDCLSRDAKSCYIADLDITKEVLHVDILGKSDYVIAKTLWNLATDTLCKC
jgi:hypothetical protein